MHNVINGIIIIIIKKLHDSDSDACVAGGFRPDENIIQQHNINIYIYIYVYMKYYYTSM